jgi:hypothetical protein
MGKVKIALAITIPAALALVGVAMFNARRAEAAVGVARANADATRAARVSDSSAWAGALGSLAGVAGSIWGSSSGGASYGPAAGPAGLAALNGILAL